MPRAGDVTTIGNGPAVVAFDVGGTDLKAGLIDEHGVLIELLREPSPSGPETAALVIDRVAELTEHFRGAHPELRIAGLGLVVPGVVDEVAGIGVESENLGWVEVPFRDLVAARTGLPVAFLHDVRAAGEAEHRIGAAAGHDDVVVLVIGTGIAGAVFINGELYAGGGFAGEIGHSIVDPDGPPCLCGGRGCLEAIGSAGAITRLYNARTGSNATGAKAVLAAAADGDQAAVDVWESALDALALGLAQLTAVIAPRAIVIGGGLASAGDALFTPLTERLDALLTFHRRPVLIPARLGEDAGLCGAALRARDAAAAAHTAPTSPATTSPTNSSATTPSTTEPEVGP